MKQLIAIICLCCTLPAWANTGVDNLLNKITMRLSAEEWVTTKTALVTVTVNASVAEKGVDRIQSDVEKQLKKLANSDDWHIIAFNRQVDNSGLEKLELTAQARLPQSALSSLRDSAKKISKAGESYTISGILFTPSFEEQSAAKEALRSKVYQLASNELSRINKQYPDQNYYIHTINFTSGPIVAETRMYMAKTAGSQNAGLSVGGKTQLSALVEFAAVPKSVATLIAKK